MASFVEELWKSILTPGPTPALIVATNVTFAVLQLLLLALLIATHSVHFMVLSVLSGGLWFAINWFVRELQAQRDGQDSQPKITREKSQDPDSDTETEAAPLPKRNPSSSTKQTISSSSLHPDRGQADEMLRKRRSLGESSGYVSTDSEWEKISDGEEKNK